MDERPAHESERPQASLLWFPPAGFPSPEKEKKDHGPDGVRRSPSVALSRTLPAGSETACSKACLAPFTFPASRRIHPRASDASPRRLDPENRRKNSRNSSPAAALSLVRATETARQYRASSSMACPCARRSSSAKDAAASAALPARSDDQARSNRALSFADACPRDGALGPWPRRAGGGGATAGAGAITPARVAGATTAAGAASGAGACSHRSP